MKKMILGAFLVFSIAFTLNTSKCWAQDVDPNQLFGMLCALCHGVDGKPTEQGIQFGSPDFTSAEWQASKTDEDLIKSMTDGTDNQNYAPVKPFVRDMLGIDIDVTEFLPKVRSFGSK
ncbi:MAG: cytochrome c [Candidatus Brocadiales bacterium]|nr:cytochrome c [Candidatus Bathyanammoxibius amoris]